MLLPLFSSPDTSLPTRVDRPASAGDTPRTPGSGERETGVSHLPVREEVALIWLPGLVRFLYFYLTHPDRRCRVVPDPAPPIGDPSNSEHGYDGKGGGRGGACGGDSGWIMCTEVLEMGKEKGEWEVIFGYQFIDTVLCERY